MLNARVVLLSALMLATVVAALLQPPLAPPVRLALPMIDWRETKPALTCPSDLPQDCVILWGP
jgi:hypothetical protein